MIRTRDLVVFATILLSLFGGIALTVLFGDQGAHADKQTEANFITPSVTDEGAIAPSSTKMDRAANIAALREKLAHDTSVIETAPPSTDTTPTGTGSTAPVAQTTAATTTSTATVDRCPAPDDAIALATQWPKSGVAMVLENGRRDFVWTESVVTTTSSTSATATSTVPMATTVKHTLLSLPLVPTFGVTASCVPSEVIGVTSNGSLIFNSNAELYRSVSANTFIGYARDGFPIFGSYKGPVDACGGYSSPAGYRYAISPDRNFIIGCYHGQPQPLTLPK